jgi:uncharacterized protein (TIGR02246 family)
VSRIDIVTAMMARYNVRDAEGYAAFFAEEGCEAQYRGDVVRDGRAGVASGMAAVFAEYPQNHAEVLQSFELGERVVLHERVRRSPEAEPFDVMTVYSFSGDRVDRVEFIR